MVAPAEQVPAGQPIKGGVPVSFPGAKAPFTYKSRRQGQGDGDGGVQRKAEVDGIKHDFNKAPLHWSRTTPARSASGPAQAGRDPQDRGSGGSGRRRCAGPEQGGRAPKASGSGLKRTAIKIDVR